MSNKDELRKLLTEHREDAWPRKFNGVEIEGVHLNLLDPDIVGLVSHVTGGSRLSEQQTSMLRELHRDAGVVADQLADDDRPYFIRLRRLAELALELAG